LYTLETRTAPAVFTVNNLNNSGADSLRNAVALANGNAGPDTIRFAVGLNGTIKLSADIKITEDVTLDGPGASRITVNGNGVSRIFDTSGAAASAAIDISGLTLSGGAAVDGGAVFIGDEVVTFTNCVLSGNTASGLGGAVFAANKLAVVAFDTTTVSGNAAAEGGAIHFTNGSVQVLDSTLSGNTATAGGGAIFFSGVVGAGGLTVRNSTISGNAANGVGGGIELDNFTGTLVVQNSTIFNNSAASGGGINRTSGGGVISVDSSIVAGNPNPANEQIFSTGLVNFNHSAVNSKTGFTITGVSNLIGASLKLGPLADNGGRTLTHLPDPQSPLVDAGSNVFGLFEDQRKFQRTIGTQTDIGAVEVLNLVVFNDLNSGPGSLRQAVNHADSLAGVDSVTFDPSFASTDGTITLAFDIHVDDDITIVGPGAKLARVSGNKLTRIFDFTGAPAGSVHAISGLTFVDGLAIEGGAILLGDEELTLADCAFIGNQALNANAGNGGAIGVNAAGSLTVRGCIFNANTSDLSGGAVGFLAGGTFLAENCTLSGNSAAGLGGAFFIGNGPSGGITLRNSTVVNNSALVGGGLLRAVAVPSDIVLRSCVISGNDSTGATDVFTQGTVDADRSLLGSSGGIFAFKADAITTALLGLDPKLGPLADNGGPTRTHLPTSDSPLINRGSNVGGLTTDQRGVGFNRVWNGVADIGAVELPPTLVVRNDLDAGPDSLRQQVLDANALPGPDTITFDGAAFAKTDGTITLTTGAINATDAVAIAGPGARLATISGNNASAILNFSGAAIGSVHTVAGFTFTAGKSIDSGAILIDDESLTVDACTFTNNSGTIAGAIGVGAAGSLTARNSTFSANVGSNGTVVVTNQGGTLLLENCTFAANTNTLATVYFFGPGGAGATIRNSTIVDNATTGTTGGVFFNHSGASALAIESSVIGDNTSPGGVDVVAIGSVLAKFSALGAVNATTGFTPDAVTTSLLGQDAKLSALANNGGPTDTILPLADSPLIGTGSNPAGLANDQRGPGYGRTRGGLVDIGAVEAPTSFVVTNTLSTGPGSLRQAVTDADSFVGPDTITFDPAVFANSSTITLGSAIAIDEAVTIQGTGANRLTVNAAKNGRAFNTSFAPAGSKIVFRGLSIINGSVSDNGGAILVGDEAVTLRDCTLSGNTAGKMGGGIYVSGGSLTVRGCTISGNTAGSYGGGVEFVGSGGLVISNSTFSGNSAGNGYGGGLGLALASGVAEVTNSTFTLNAAKFGGGIGVESGPVTIVSESTIFAGNSATSNGSDVYTLGTLDATTTHLGSAAGVTTLVNDAVTLLLLGQPANLGPLTDNGGPTPTHALLATSPAIGQGSNPDGLVTDQRGRPRVVGNIDIGAFELQPGAKVAAVIVGDGTNQRSTVTQLRVSFDSLVTFAGSPAAAFLLARPADAKSVTLAAAVDDTGPGTVVTLTFTGGAVDGQSLADGRFTLTVLAGQLRADGLDGNGDGTAGDDYVLVGHPAVAPRLFRLFGDADGDGDVDAQDFGAFRGAFGSVNATFDFDNDGDVDAADFGQFRARFGSSV